MDVSIIIVNYNTKNLTLQCIDSIYEKTNDVSFEIIVVDNKSTDGSQELLSHDKRIVFVEAGENLGFGKANNLGLRQAQGKYIFFLNSDTLLLNNAVKEFFIFAESQTKNIGAIGCLLTDKLGRVIHSFSEFPSINWVFKSVVVAHFFQLFFKKKYQLYDKADSDITLPVFQVDYVTGADLFVRRTVIDKYGAFDPDFFMYYEESEMQYRWSKNGYLSYIIKTPQIIHFEGGSQKKNTDFNVDKFIRSFNSEKSYFKKTKSRCCYFLYRLSALIYIFVFIKNKLSFKNMCIAVNVLFR